MMSQSIKKTIHKDEEVKKYFSICGRYIKLKITALLLKWLLIFIAVSIVLYLVFLFSPINETSGKKFPIKNVLIFVSLFFFLIVVPFIIFFNNFYLRISNEFVFTDKRIIVKKGWIETKVKTIYYDRITDISVSQSFLDRLIKTGTLSISTAGSDGYEAIINHIRKPYEVKNVLYEVKNKSRENIII
jgi:uncharacterized membrane protein YdbT with pleckstrin-like domain